MSSKTTPRALALTTCLTLSGTPFAPNCPVGTMEVRTFVGDGTAGSGGELDSGGFDLFFLNQGFTFVIP